MDDAKFNALIDAYGGDPERWPAEARVDARTRLADARPEDRSRLKEAAALDALLREVEPATARAALLGRILGDAPSATRSRPLGGGAIALGLAPRARLAAAGLLVLSLGVIAGWSASHDAVAVAAGDALLVSAYGEPLDELFTVGEL